MRLQEFKDRINEIANKYNLNLKVTEDTKNIYVKLNDVICAYVNKILPCFMSTDSGGLYCIAKKARFEILEALYELSKTPFDEREEEKKYYLKHKFLLSDNEYNFLNYLSNDDSWDLSSLANCSGYQTKFTQKEIEELKEKYDTTLDDFEIIEVEE